MDDVLCLDRIYRKPILKWLGGKSDSLDYIFGEFTEPAQRFIEPFMGSAIVGLNVDAHEKILADINKDLVWLYQHVVKCPEQLIKLAQSYFLNGNAQDLYYARRECFNATPVGSIERAALFLYLNRHCFNGVCRYNASGEFNVPFGKYSSINLPQKEIVQFSEVMQNTTFVCADFREVMSNAKEGDVIYCDPPYVPVVNAGFVNYSGSGFTEADQKDLADCARSASQRGATVLISNHWVKGIEELYAGATFRQVYVRRSVASKGPGRARTAEVLAVFDHNSHK